MSEDVLTIRIKGDATNLKDALDQATAAVEGTAATISSKMTTAQDELNASMGEAVKGANQLGVSVFALYTGYDNLHKVEVAADSANLKLAKSVETAENAQAALNKAITKFGPSSAEAKQAADKLAIAQEQLSINADRAEIAQSRVGESYGRFALSVIPTVISGIDAVTRIQKSWNGVEAMGTTIRAVGATVWGVLTGKIALSAVATSVMTAAQGALNAVMAINPIFLVVAALAALILALKWAYDNVKPFHDAVNALGEFLSRVFKPVIDAVVGALNWLGNAWGWLTGQTRRANEAQTRAIEEATKAQLADIEKRYAEMETAAKDSYDKQVADASKAWLDKLNVEATGFDKVLEEYGKHYDKLEDEVATALDKQVQEIEKRFKEQEDVVSDALDEQLDAVKTAYEDQTDAIKTEYDRQIGDTENYYDELIGVVKGGLSSIRDAREKDLDDLELHYLLQKEAADNAYAAGELTKEDHEKVLENLEAAYRATREAKSQDYRIQELQYEQAHAGELERLEADKAAALTAIKQATDDRLTALETQYNLDVENLKRTAADQIAALEARRATAEEVAKRAADAKITALEKQRNADLAAIREEMARMAADFEAKLAALEQQKAAERNAIVQKAEDQKAAIVSTSNAANLTTMDKYHSDMVARSAANSRALANIWGGMVSAAQSVWSAILGVFSRSVPTPTLPSVPGPTAPTLPQDGGAIPVVPPTPAPTPAPVPIPTPAPIPTPTSFPTPVSVYRGGVLADVWQRGFEGVVTRPTLALVGEAGPETVSVRPGARETSPNMTQIDIKFTGPITIAREADVEMLYRGFSDRLRSELKNLGIGALTR